MVHSLLSVLLQASSQKKILKGDKTFLSSFVGGKSTITPGNEIKLKRQNIDAFPFVQKLTKSAPTMGNT